MVKGDIDLTENLDFYHDKKEKQLPVLPWRKEKEKTYLNTDDIEVPISSTSFMDYSWSSYYYNVSPYSTNNTISYTNYNFTLYYEILDDDGRISLPGSTWTSAMTNFYNITLPDPYYNEILDDNFTYKYYPNDIKEKEDIFGGYKKKKKINNVKLNYCSYCRRHLESCKCNKYNKLYSLSKSEILSVKSDDNINRELNTIKEIYRSRRFKRKEKEHKRKIPWLRHLNHRIYEDYIDDLHEEKDYSKYLTDMSWLGIRD